LMAIGHTDRLSLKDGEVSDSHWNELETSLLRSDPERSRGSITSHANQVRAFSSEIKVNDLVVTLDSRSLMVGRVSGNAFIEKKGIKIEYANGHTSEMNFLLRRPVDWGPRMRRADVPAALEMTLLAHQTVFNLDTYWQAIYHLMYPVFSFRDTLYFSTLISQ